MGDKDRLCNRNVTSDEASPMQNPKHYFCFSSFHLPEGRCASHPTRNEAQVATEIPSRMQRLRCPRRQYPGCFDSMRTPRPKPVINIGQYKITLELVLIRSLAGTKLDQNCLKRGNPKSIQKLEKIGKLRMHSTWPASAILDKTSRPVLTRSKSAPSHLYQPQWPNRCLHSENANRNQHSLQ